MPSVLLTGAAGFIGSHFAERLLAEGYQVIGVDNLVTGQRSNLAALERDHRFRFIEQDVTEALTVGEPLAGVLHLASPASPVDYLNLPVETLMVNSIGTRHTLELAAKKGARYLLASTSEVYGDPQEHPQPESYWGHVNPVGVRAVYDEAKRFAEALTMAYHRKRRVDVRIVRIFNTYGPRMRPEDGRVVSNFIRQALAGEPLTLYGDGSQTRSFCYVSDEVEGLFRLFCCEALGRAEHVGPVNIGNPHEMSVLELAERVLALTGSSSPIVRQDLPQDDPQQRQPDIERARALLGWEPIVSLEDGLRQTIEYFRSLAARRPSGADAHEEGKDDAVPLAAGAARSRV